MIGGGRVDNSLGRAYESQVIGYLWGILTNDPTISKGYVPGLRVLDMRIEGPSPPSVVAIVFQHPSQPGATFGYRAELDPHRSDPLNDASDVATILQEIIESDPGLPRSSDPREVHWLH